MRCIQKVEPPKGGAYTRRSLHVMVFLIDTMSCIQKAEPPKRRSLHKAVMICYGVFNRKRSQRVASTILEVSPFLTMSFIQKAEPPKRWSLHKADTACYGVFNIKGHHELHPPSWRSRLFLIMSCIHVFWA